MIHRLLQPTEIRWKIFSFTLKNKITKWVWVNIFKEIQKCNIKKGRDRKPYLPSPLSNITGGVLEVIGGTL
jgi:hypothetical protein